MSICLNCGTALTDNYCSHCGQKAAVKKLNWHSLGEEVFHFFTHIEKGFLKTTGQLIINPARLTKEYLDGKRKKYHKPIGFLLIWITVFTLIYQLSQSLVHYRFSDGGKGTSFFDFTVEQYKVLGNYRSIIELILLPVNVFISWLFIGRPKLNYPEVLTVFFYFMSFLFIWMSVQYTAALVVGINFKTPWFDMVITGVFLVWFIIAGYRFYRQYAIKFLVLRIIISLTVATVIYFWLMTIIVNQLIAWHF